MRRGSVGLGRSKSVRCSRVKFGLVSLDDDDDGDDDEGDQGSAKGKTKREAGAQIAESHLDGLERREGLYGTLSEGGGRVQFSSIPPSPPSRYSRNQSGFGSRYWFFDPSCGLQLRTGDFLG